MDMDWMMRFLKTYPKRNNAIDGAQALKKIHSVKLAFARLRKKLVLLTAARVFRIAIVIPSLLYINLPLLLQP